MYITIDTKVIITTIQYFKVKSILLLYTIDVLNISVCSIHNSNLRRKKTNKKSDEASLLYFSPITDNEEYVNRR